MSEIEIFDSTQKSNPKRGHIIPEDHVVVTWPLSQDLMVEPWFESEARLVNGGILGDIFGDAAYVVPRRHVKTDVVGVHTPEDVHRAVAEKS